MGSSKHISFLLQRGEPRNSSYLGPFFSKATPILSFYHLYHSAQQKIKMKIAIYSALFCLILGSQVFAKPQAQENVFHVEVQSPVLYLTKPKDRDAKRKEK